MTKEISQNKNKKRKMKEEEKEGDIAWVLNALTSFPACFNSLAPAPRPYPKNALKKFKLLQLNDHVYELCNPSGRPSVEIVFFHGFQLGGSKETYFFTTWLSSRQKSELWLHWIKGSFPEARILLVSYDGFATKTDDQGRTDMYVTRENLLHSLIDDVAQVGQDGCPVVFVGHSLGGLVMKEVLLQANKILSLNGKPNERLLSLLENVKQLFYYSCPHNGIRLADIKTKLPRGPLFDRLTILNNEAARCNEDFRQLRKTKYSWRAYTIGEELPTNLGSLGSHLVVEEASARHDTDHYYTVHADHFSVCQPTSTIDARCSKLTDVIGDALQADVHGHKMKFSCELVGLDEQVNRVQQRLGKAQHLGICGIGGIGKTTLAKTLYNQISGNFEYTSFLSEVKKSMGEKVSIEDLQAEILKNLYYKGRKCDVKWDRLKGKRVLIILDDVEYDSQVFVMTGSHDFSNKSRVVVTSRYRKILTSKDFQVHDTAVLDDAASRKLFCSYAFREQDAPKPFKGHVARFVKKCGGLPLALEVAGKYLYKQQEDVWNDAFKRLRAAKPLSGKKSVEDRFWSIFEVIYEALQEDEQQMFLDVAACFHGARFTTVKRAWGCCDWVTTADAGWQNLSDIGLITVVENDWNDKCIYMHEVLRDFGCSKACRNPRGVESHIRVCYEGITQLPTGPFQQAIAQVKILKIAMDAGIGSENRPVVDIKNLRGLENLKILWLENVSLRGPCNLLPDNLQFLRLKLCTWSDESRSRRSSSRKSPRHLELELCYELEGLLSTLGQLAALEYLDFHRCWFPQSFPNVFEPLRALKYLSIREYDDIDYEEALEALPDSLGELPALENLEIVCTELKSLPESLGQLQSLKELHIACWEIESIPDSLGQLSVLETLTIQYCVGVRGLPSMPELRALHRLEISDCDELTALPESLGQLPALQFLIIKSCYMLLALPNTLGQLQNLRLLRISWCVELVALPNTLDLLQSLRQFEIDACGRLTALPANLGQLPCLRHFKIVRCEGLRNLPGTLGNLQALEYLEVAHCHNLEALPDNLAKLQALRTLKISNCRSLKALPDALEKLPALEHLEIKYCRDLNVSPVTIRELQSLRHLEIVGCQHLKDILPQL